MGVFTSCILSKALAWSSVSMEGDRPPWRQKICRAIKYDRRDTR